MREYPERGDFVHLDFDPKAGHEKGGPRFGLVLSPGVYNNASGLAVVAPITSRQKGYPFEAPIPDGERCYGVVLADHTRSIDWRARGVKIVGQASQALVEDVLARYLTLLT